MTTPILGLGITASGAQAVADLARSVNSLADGLVKIKATAGGGEIQALSEMAAQIRGMRSEITQGLAGVQATLVEGFNKAYASAAAEVDKGAAKVAQAQERAKAKLRYSARADQGGGLSASISGTDAESVRKMAAEAALSADGIKAAAEKVSQAKLLYRIKLMVGNQQLVESLALAAQKEEDAKLSYRIKLMTGSAKIAEDVATAAQKESDAKLSYRIKLMAGSAKIAEDQALASAREEEGRLSYRIKLMTGSAKIAEDQALAAAREDEGKLSYRIKMMAGSAKIAEQQVLASAREEDSKLSYRIKLMAGSAKIAEQVAASAEKEDAAKLAYRIKMMSGSAKIVEDALKEAAQVDLAARTKEAAYARLSRSGQIGMVMGARSQLDAGISPSVVTSRFGSTATGAAAATDMAQLRAQLEGVGAKAAAARPHIESLSGAMKDAHSAVRGLASGFDAMFLTWGNIVPLLAGAAVSHAFVQAIKQGAEFEQTMAVIGHVAGQTSDEMGAISQATLELARSGPYGPNEVAKAMKTLALAGLDAKQQLAAIKPTLDFAMVGEMSLEKSAETLVAVSTAFGFTAKDFGVVSDIIAKTAAVSMASVEGMASSFKNASAIAQVYKVSIDDVALSLALMAQVGIKNQEAGTAVRAMYTQLATGGAQAQKILHEVLKVDVIDNATKAMRPLSEIMMDLAKSLSTMTFEAQIQALQKMSAQRGMKTLAADLTAYITEAQKAGVSQGDLNTKFKEMAEAIKDAPGFSAMTAIGLGTTAFNNMKMVASDFQAALVTGFQGVNSEVTNTSRLLQEVFKSKGFQEGLSELISGVATVVRWLMDNVTTLEALVVGYVAGKAAVLAYSLATGAAAVVEAFFTAAKIEGAGASALAATADVALAGATVAVGTASATAAVPVGLFVASFGPIAIIAAAAAAAYFMFADTTKKGAVDIEAAHAKASESIKGYTDTVLGGLDKEIARLEAIAKEREKGSTGAIAAAKVEANLVRDGLEQKFEEEMSVLRLSRTYAELARNKFAAAEYSKTAGGAAELKRLDDEVNRVTQQMQATFTRQDRAMLAFNEKQARMFELSRQEAAAAKAEIDKNNKNRPTGDGTMPAPHGQLASSEYAQQKSEIERIIEAKRQEAQVVDAAAKQDEAVAKQAYEQGAASFQAYQDRLTEIARTRTSARSNILAQEIAQTTAELKVLTGKADALDPKHADVKDKLNNDIELVRRKLEEDKLSLVKASNEEYNRQTQLITDQLRPAANLLQNADKERATLQNNFEQELARLAVKRDIVEVSAKEQFIQGEILKGTNKQADYVAQLKAAMDKNVAAGLYEPENNVNGPQALENILTVLQQAQRDLDTMKDRLRGGAAVFFDAKAIDDARKKAEDLWQRDEKKIEDGIFDAIGKGGNSGFKKLMQDAKSWFARLVLSPIIQPIAAFGASIINPNAASALNGAGASGVNTTLGAVNGASTLYNLGSTAGSVYTVGSQYAAGTMSGLNAAGTVGANATGTGISGLLAVNGGYASSAGAATTTFGVVDSTIGTTAAVAGGTEAGVAAGASTAGLAAIPWVGWAAIAAIAIYSLMSKGGGPKADGKFGTTYGGIASLPDDLSRDPAISKNLGVAVTGLQAQYDALAKNFGGVAGDVQFGMGVSTDPKGDSPTFLEMAATKNGKQLFSNENKNVGRSADDLAQAISVASTDALLGALKASDLTKEFKDFFNKIANDATVETKQAAIKVAGDVAAYAQTVTHLGGAFDKLTSVSIEARGSMINTAGGLQALQQATQSYFNNFYKADERKSITIQRIGDVFKSAGQDLSKIDLSAADARVQFRNLVDSLDMNTEAGRNAFNSLIGVSDAFASVTTSLDDATVAARTTADILSEQQGLQKTLNDLMLDTAANRRTELAALDPSNRALQERIYLLTDAKTGTDVAMAALKRAIDAQKTLLQAQADAAQKSIDTLQSLFDFLTGQVNELYNQTLPQMMGDAGRQFVTDALSIARATGNLPNQTALSNSITAARGIGDNTFKTGFDAMFAKLTLAGQLSELKEMSSNQLTDAQKQLKAAQDQIAALDKLATDAQTQIDALRGIDVSVTTVTQAINNLAVAMKLESALTGRGVIDGPISTGSNNVTAAGTSDGGISWSNGVSMTGDQFAASQKASQFRNSAMLMYEGLLGRVQDQGAAAWVEQAYNQGGTLDDIAKTIKGSSEYSSFTGSGAANPFQSLIDSGVIPHFATGTNRVSQDMLAFIHKDEAVVPAAYNPAGGGHDDVAVAINDLRQEQRAQASAQVQWQRRFTKLMERWDADGMPETRVV